MRVDVPVRMYLHHRIYVRRMFLYLRFLSVLTSRAYSDLTAALEWAERSIPKHFKSFEEFKHNVKVVSRVVARIGLNYEGTFVRTSCFESMRGYLREDWRVCVDLGRTVRMDGFRILVFHLPRTDRTVHVRLWTCLSSFLSQDIWRFCSCATSSASS